MADPRDARIAELEEQVAQLQVQLAAVQVHWVRRAVDGALAETRQTRRSVLTGRCIP